MVGSSQRDGGLGGLSTWQPPRLCSDSKLQTQLLTPATPLHEAGQATDAAASVLGSRRWGQRWPRPKAAARRGPKGDGEEKETLGAGAHLLDKPCNGGGTQGLKC